MSSISTAPITSQAVWEEFIATRPEASFLQSWQWGTFQERIGNHIYRVGFYSGETLVGVLLSSLEVARRARYLVIAGGPIIDWENKTVVTAVMNEVRRQATEQRCSFVRMRPQLEKSEASVALFAKLGWTPAPMHLGAEFTHQLDITPSEEILLAQMRKSTRYELKKAQKLGIVVTASEDPTDCMTFYRLQLETAERHHFTPFSYSFLHEQFSAFAEQRQAVLYSAYYEDTLLAQAIIIFYGQEAVYHYGASTEAARKYPGAYALQWEAIKEARARGLQRYNFWGVADDPHHRYYSLSIFKRGFGGYDFSYLHAHDLVINPFWYAVNFVVEYTRKKIRKLS